MRNPSASQRELSKNTRASLGLVNFIVKNFIKTGYVSMVRLSKRKTNYQLTAQGLQEAVNKYHHEATYTIRKYKGLENKVAKLLTDLHHAGYDYFSIHGDGELKAFIDAVFRECMEDFPVKLGQEMRSQPSAVVLNVSAEEVQSGFKGDVVNVLQKLVLEG